MFSDPDANDDDDDDINDDYDDAEDGRENVEEIEKLFLQAEAKQMAWPENTKCRSVRFGKIVAVAKSVRTQIQMQMGFFSLRKCLTFNLGLIFCASF